MSDLVTRRGVAPPPDARARRSRYRVDNVAWFIRPFYLTAAWTFAFSMYFYYLVCRLTSRILIEGPGDHNLSRHAIYCMWHENWWPYFVVFRRYPRAHALFSHPAAYMKPLHALLRLMGVKRLFLGSSGEEGREAAKQVAALVRNGWSTTISPDGPYGPPRVLKKGVLYMALQSGAPIVPLALSSSRFLPWPSWDSKKIPLPFSRIRVRFHQPIQVNHDNFDSVRERLTRALSAPG